MSKKIIHVAFFAIILAGFSTLSSCKKGENDPFLSLSSRKARISGEWKLNAGELSQISTGTGFSFTFTETYTSSTYTNPLGITTPYSETLTIDKNGTYEVTIMDDGDTYTIKGVWFFAGKVKDLDLKNKEAIVMVVQELSEPGYFETYNGLYGGDVMMIDQLKSKEIIFKGSTTYTDDSGDVTVSTYDRTFVQQ